MKALWTFAESPFENPKISSADLFAYTTDHLERMKSGNADGKLDERIAVTAAAFVAFRDTVTADQITLGSRKGRKMSKRKFRKKMRSRLQRLEAAVVANFLPPTEQLKRVFPEGRGVIMKAPDDRLKGHLRTVINGLKVYEAEVGADVVAAAEALLAEWLPIYEESEKSTAEKAASEERKRNARSALSWELYVNILRIVELYPRQPEKIEQYAVQSLLGFTKPRGRRRG